MFVETKREGETQIKQSVKTAWVTALRSGRYRQATQHLRASGAYCCLGVLCRIAGIPLTRDGTACGPVKNYRNRDYDPIYEIVGDNKMVKVLMRMNDMGDSFDQIANWIDANWHPNRRT